MNNLRNMKKQGGFTLIELMIVIAILAILMAIAIPAYQDYAIRSKVSEAVSVAGGAKVAVAETFQATGDFPNTQASYGWDFTASDYVTSVAIDGDGQITATTVNTGAPTPPVLTFTPNTAGGRINWVCGNDAGAAEHLPAECR